jgi:hypothetical protein
LAGIDTVRGIAFQLAQALGDVIELVVESDGDAVVIEGADDVVDYEVLDRNARRLAVRQAKTRREPGTWGATELARVLCAWGEVDDADDAEFAFVTDASLNDSGQKLCDLIQAMRERPDEAVLRQTATTLGRGGVHLPSLDVLRRAQILTRMGSTEQVLAQAEMRILTLLSRSRIATLDDAANAANALFRRLFVIGGNIGLGRRTISRTEVLAALGIDEVSLRGGLAWSNATMESYRAAIVDASRQVHGFFPLDVMSVASTPKVLRLLERPGRSVETAQPLDVVLDDSSAVLVGATGQGKTTTLMHLGRVAAERGLVPVTFQAAGHTPGSLPRRVRHAVEARLGQALTIGALDMLLVSPALVLLIDGVSEVDADTRDALRGDLQRLAAQRPVRVIATGRDLPLAIAVTTMLDVPAAYRLTTLDHGSRRQLASAQVVDDQIVSMIEHQLGDAADNPMLFLMALSVSTDGVPDTRAEVYQQFLHGLAARAGLEDEDIRVAAIGAAWMSLIGRGLRTADHYTWRSSLSIVLNELFRQLAWPDRQVTPADALFHAQAMGLLTRLDPDSGLAPLHDSFADFLAARAVVRGQAALPTRLDNDYDETVVFTVEMAGLSDDLAYRLAAENPLLACRVARLPQAHGVADPAGVGRLLKGLADGSVLPLLDTLAGLRLCRHDRFTGVVLAGDGYDEVDNTGFQALIRQHSAIMLPTHTSSLQLAIVLWATAIRRAHRPQVRVFQPAPPADPEAATQLLPEYVHAVEVELHRLVNRTLPTTIRGRVLAALGPQGMLAYVDDPEPGPLGGLDVLVHYRRDPNCLVARTSGQRADNLPGTTETTLARLMRRHPTEEAAHAISEARGAVTSGTWPKP